MLPTDQDDTNGGGEGSVVPSEVAPAPGVSTVLGSAAVPVDSEATEILSDHVLSPQSSLAPASGPTSGGSFSWAEIMDKDEAVPKRKMSPSSARSVHHKSRRRTRSSAKNGLCVPTSGSRGRAAQGPPSVSPHPTVDEQADSEWCEVRLRGVRRTHTNPS